MSCLFLRESLAILLLCFGNIVIASFHTHELECGKAISRMIGGDAIRHAKFPYIVSVQVKSATSHGEWRHICGGSIVRNDLALTACYCVHEKRLPLVLRNPKSVQIVAGSGDLRYDSEETEKRYARELIPHRHCRHSKGVWHNDVGLIVLTHPLEFNRQVQPIQLFSRDPKLAQTGLSKLQERGVECYSPGWGIRSVFKGEDICDHARLRYIDTKLLLMESCKEKLCNESNKYCRDFEEHDKVCAVSPWGSPCRGDGGGPLICMGYVFGTVAHGFLCKYDVPHLYTGIKPILDLILEH